jgi:hypothetical protein
MIDDRCFGYEYVMSGAEAVDAEQKECAQASFGTVAFDRTAHLFAGDESDAIGMGVFTIKEDEPRRMPCRIGMAIDRIVPPRISDPLEML